MRGGCALAAVAAVAECLGQPPRQVPLHGNATLGYYFAIALVGDGQQRQALIVDTGSCLTVFACREECADCGRHAQPRFAPGESFRYVMPGERQLDWECSAGFTECGFDQRYLEGSRYQGRYARDRFALEGEVLRPRPDFALVFGCATSETGVFATQDANGVLGLGVRSALLPPTLVESERFHRQAARADFSVCLGRSGGKLRFGAPNREQWVRGAAQQTIPRQRLPWTSVYAVPLTRIFVGSLQLEYDFAAVREGQTPAFFDTGSTLTYFSPALFERWTAAVAAFCTGGERCAGVRGYQQCYDSPLPLDEFALGFPAAAFHFGDSRYEWLPRDYLADHGAFYCFGVRPLKDVVLGANFMRDHDITIDQTAQTVSFARADCAGEGLPAPGPPPAPGVQSAFLLFAVAAPRV